MIITKKFLDRRTFLQGAGAAVALPLLDAMIPASTAEAQTAAAPVRRFAAAYLPNGMVLSHWTPASVGAHFELTPTLKPFEPVRDQMVVVSGLSSGPMRAGGHALAGATFLTGVQAPNRTEGADLRAGTTIDQVLAEQYAGNTVFPSLELATEDFTTAVGACEIGFSCAYLNTISWRTPVTPLPMEINPRMVFERMFGEGGGTPEQRELRLRKRRSVLDAVSEQAKQLQARLGSTDRRRLDDYVQGVREIELRIQRAEQQKMSSATALNEPVGVPEDFIEHVSLMYDLMVIAFQSDITRVFSFMMARELSNRTYPSIGITEPHHALSHHQNKPERVERYARTNAFHAQLAANFLTKLKATPDGAGSLLDHSLFLLGCGMSDGNTHSFEPLPVALFGGDSGRLKGDRHIAVPEHTPLANLHLTLAQRGGAKMDRFGDGSTGTIDL